MVTETKFDLSRLTIEDYRLLVGNATFVQMVDLMDRAAIGGIAHLPMTAIPELATQFLEAIKDAFGVTPLDEIEQIAREAWDNDD